MDIICPKCGARSSKKKFIDAFCEDCYEFKFKLPKPSDVRMTICKRCDKVLFKGEWLKFNPSKVAEAIQHKCRGAFENVEYDDSKGILRFCFKLDSGERCLERDFRPETNYGLCPDCSRMSGGYFEAIVQLRGDNPPRLKQFADSLEKRLKEKTFVSKVDEKKEGLDLYIGSSKAVIDDFNKRGIPCKMSSKIFGKDKEGRTLYRTTFLVRL